jgi:hypothetical protein
VSVEPCICGLKLFRDTDHTGTRTYCERHSIFVRKESDGTVTAQLEPFPQEPFDAGLWPGLKKRGRGQQQPSHIPKNNLFTHADFARHRPQGNSSISRDSFPVQTIDIANH